MAGLLGH